MSILQNQDLSQLNTFRLQSQCEYFFEINRSEDFENLQVQLKMDWKKISKKILGGGSNLILSEKVSGLVLKNNLKGIHTVDRYVHVASGEIWHDFVGWCLKNKFYGLENLSLIPGTVGAAPIQNIGAYGIEVKKFIHAVKGIHLDSGLKRELLNSSCHFEYRNSIFKTEDFKDFFITEVVFFFPEKTEMEYSYGELKEYFQTTVPTPEKIAEKVIEIRSRKLPDLQKYPNAGSYFKNPLISIAECEKLKINYPDLVSYPYSAEKVKLSAGQLIEKCGFKGKVHGTCSMYEKQALVMVNLGKSFFQDVLSLEQAIIKGVHEKFQVKLESEPIKW